MIDTEQESVLARLEALEAIVEEQQHKLTALWRRNERAVEQEAAIARDVDRVAALRISEQLGRANADLALLGEQR